MSTTPLEAAIVEQAYTHFGIVADDSEILAFVRHMLPLLAPALVNCELRSGLVAALEWIDAVPADTPLPTMPGFDRDDIDKLVDGTKSIAGSPSLLKAARAVLAMEDGPYIGPAEQAPFTRLRAAVDSVPQNASAVENVMRGIRIREINVSDVEKDLHLPHDRARPSTQKITHSAEEIANVRQILKENGFFPHAGLVEAKAVEPELTQRAYPVLNVIYEGFGRRVALVVDRAIGIKTGTILYASPHLPVAAETVKLIAVLKAARSMLNTVADCASHECEDCREHAALHRDAIDAAMQDQTQ